jgi:hypothetical protein
MVGRIEDGFSLLGSVAAPEASEVRGLGPAGGQLAKFTRLVVAVQIGEPARAGALADELAALEGAGGDDPSVVLGMVALQRGDLAAAATHLAPDGPSSTDPNLEAARAILAAAAGLGGAAALADQVTSIAGSTYLDQAMAQAAASLEAAAQGRATDALARIEQAWSLVSGTQDQVARAIVDLIGCRVADCVSSPESARSWTEVEAELVALGIEPVGWQRIADLALAAVPA